LFVERNVPDEVPAKISLPSLLKAQTELLVRPEFDAAHDAPLSVERKTPPPLVPTRSVDWSSLTPNVHTFVFVSPVFDAAHVAPPSVERKTPPCPPI
jgi:hypothetical protein